MCEWVDENKITEIQCKINPSTYIPNNSFTIKK